MRTFVLAAVLFSSIFTPAETLAQRPDPANRKVIVPSPSAAPRSADRLPGRIDSSFNAERRANPRRSASSRSPGTVFSVTTLNDTGAGSLRRAIEDANNSPGRDVIQFSIPGAGPHTIVLKSTLDVIVDPVEIDGSTQPGYAEAPLIRIDGDSAGAANGLDIAAGSTIVKAIAVTRFSNDGIVLGSPGNDAIEGCYVGIAPDGVTAAGNGRYGVRVLTDSNRIGNPDGNTNVISGNGNDGIEMVGPGAGLNIIRNCYVGTNATGSAAVPNAGFGVYIAKSSDDTLGGPSYSRNVISGNAKAGISIRGSLASRIVILGNNIGADRDGLLPIGNDNGIEIAQEEVPILGTIEGTPSFITIGGPGGVAGQLANTISGNRGAGIAIFQDTLLGNNIRIIGNRIGANSFDTDTIPNTIAGIFIRKYTVGGAQTGVLIGGATGDSANVVCGNRQHGIWIRGTGARYNVLRGNHVGVTPSNQLLFMGNGMGGIVLDSAGYNLVGGVNRADGNFVGRNRGGGIALLGPNARENLLLNNSIGAKFLDLNIWAGNALDGLYIESSSNVVGASGMENTIAGSGEAGIFVYSGTGNTLRFNRTFNNNGLGIDLSPPGVTRNDTLDGDSGPNDLVNFPVLDSATIGAGTIRVRGHMVGAPNTTYRLDFFKAYGRNPSKFGEGEIWLDSLVVTTDPQGMAPVTATIAAVVSDDQFITAIATDPSGNTSEFTRALCLKDSDGDGILDCWESAGDGIDVNADGLIDLDLYAKTARPGHKDLFVEVDHMEGFEPAANAFALVKAAFAAVPARFVGNPDLQPGINLVVEHEPADVITPAAAWANPPWPQFYPQKTLHFGTIADRADSNRVNILEAKRLVYRYCIFADNFHPEGWSGVAEAVDAANDFIVTLGHFPTAGGTQYQQAGTFMHELGHTLGLGHGGGDHIHFKPNYYSVMNYLWQFPQSLVSNQFLSWRLVYATSPMGTLNENNLIEADGVQSVKGDYPVIITPFTSTGGLVRTGVVRNRRAIDWDGNGDSSGAAAGPVDLNAYKVASPGEVLTSHADWPNLQFNFRNGPYFDNGIPNASLRPSAASDTIDEEMTPALYEYLNTLPPYGEVLGYGVPEIQTTDTTILGGRYAYLEVQLLGPAPPGGVTYHVEVSDSTLFNLQNGNQIIFPEGQTVANILVTVPEVDSDTTGFVRISDAMFETKCTLHISPAHLLAADRLPTDLNVVGGFIKEIYNTGDFLRCGERYVDSLGRYSSLSGQEVTVLVVYDGRIGPSGAAWKVWSSAPQAFPDTTVFLDPGFTSEIKMNYQPSPGVLYPDSMRVFCSIYSDTVSFMVYFTDGPRFTIRDLTVGALPCQQAIKINNLGEILGTWGGAYAVWKNGSLTFVDSLPGFAIDVPSQLNDSGDIAGVVNGSGGSFAAVWRNGITRVLPDTDVNRPYSIVTGLNNNGTVIGYFDITTGYWNDPKGFVWLGPSSVVELGLPMDALYTVPLGINDAGKVVGWTTHRFRDSSNHVHDYISSFSWTGGDPDREAFLCPWYDGSCCWAGYGPMYTMINNRGTIVGTNGGNNRVDRTGGMIAYANWPESAIWAYGPWWGEGHVNDWITNDGNWFDLNENDDAAGAGGLGAMVVLDKKIYAVNALAAVPPGTYLTEARGILDDRRMIVNATGAGGARGYLLVPDGATTGVPGNGPATVPRAYVLDQNYPNPFNPVTTIRFGLPAAGRVSLKIYDVLGREVAVLLDDIQSPGYHAVGWDAGKFPSGVYFYRLTAGSSVLTKGCVLLK